MKSEPIKRNRYSDPPFNEGDFSARNFDEDFNEFHLPLNRMQLANFQDWGIAQGLEVSGSIGGTALTIAPGVAANIQGQLISLATEGKGDIGSNPPSEEHQEVDVPVILDLSHFAETENTSYFVTIQFSQILRFDEGPLGRYEDAPWIRLQLVDEFVADGNSLVLARVTINSNGELTDLQSQGRRLASKTVQELSLRRPQLLDEQVQQVDAGKIASTVNGLEITVSSTDNEILLSQKDGDNFTQLTVNADNSNFRGNINATQNLQVEGAIASSSLTVNGNSNLNQNLQVEGAIASSSLTVNGNSNLNQNLQVEGALAVNDNANIQGNLTVSGNLEVQGDVTARDVEHVSGNVSFGDEDNDEVKITGVLRSGHSSGALEVDDALEITDSLTVDKNLGIGTKSPSERLQIADFSVSSNNYLKISTAGGNRFKAGIKFKVFNDGFGFTIENDERHESNGLNILRHDNNTAGISALFIDKQNGNVGIGTTSPGAKLHIVHTNQNANGNALIIGPTSQSNLRLGYHQNYSWIQSHGSKPLAINPVGNNVGIGTTNPRSKLDVNGWIFISGGNGLRFYKADNKEYWHIYPEWHDPGDPDLMFDYSRKTQHTGWVRGWLEPQGGWKAPSDRRIKQDIEPLANILEEVMKLQPKSYRWIDSEPDSRKFMGFIAQEVEQVFPDCVTEKRDLKGLNYNDFAVMAIAAIQEQQKQIDLLHKEMAELKPLRGSS